MAKQSRGRGRSKKQSKQRRHLQPVPTEPDAHDDLPLIPTLSAALHTGDPIDLLVLVSSMLAALDPRSAPLHRAEDEGRLEEFVESFIEIARVETTAALYVIHAFSSDDLLRARISRELSTRHHRVPKWLPRLDDARVYSEVTFVGHQLGDGDNYVFSVRLASGHTLSTVAYVDHNLGTVVKDAFVIPASHAEVVSKLRANMDIDVGGVLEPVDPATARAILTEAIAHGARVVPPLESDTWPLARPLVEWTISLLPPGGRVPEVPEWTDVEYDQLVDDFMSSPRGEPFGELDAALLDELLWMRAPDPMRWSPVAVEVALLSNIPGRVLAPVEDLSRYPMLLRAFISYCHERRGILPELTRQTLDAVDRWEPEFADEIRADHPPRAEQLAKSVLAQLNDDAPFELGTGDDDGLIGFHDLYEFRLEMLASQVGGREVLATLDDAPLPDEDFDPTGIDEDILPAVDDVLRRVDECAETFFDIEVRTAMRRFLARAARNDPAIFRRKGSPARAAAAVAWAVGKANSVLAGPFATTTIGELLAWFGVKGSVSQRAEPFLAANGIDLTAFNYGDAALGTADLLTSQQKREIIVARDRPPVG